MIGVTLEGLRTRRLRAVLTVVAVVLGVAMISGTYVLMDTTTHAFGSLFTTAYEKADAVIVGRSPTSSSGLAAPPVAQSLAARVRSLPQVRAVQGLVMDPRGQLRTAGGHVISGTVIALGAPSHRGPFSTLQIVAGHRAAGPHQIAIDEQTATDNHLSVGSTVEFVSLHPLERFRVVGIARYGGVGSLGPLRMVAFDLPVAQRLFDKRGEYDQIYVAGRAGVSGRQLVAAIAPLLPASAQVRTRAQEVQSRTNDVDSVLSAIRDVLLTFAGIALFVGSFVIFNTLSVTVAQRTREFATLRTLGASRRQILVSVVLEAAILGIVASAAGLFAGLGVAAGLQAMFSAFGAKLPNAGTVFALRTVIVSLAAGSLITILASLTPAVRATRVPPIAAVAEGAALPSSRLARVREPVIGTASVAGLLTLGIGLFMHGLATGTRLMMLGAGVAVLFLAVAYYGRWVMAPLAALIGSPFARRAGVPGMLARENSSRNPGRTAITSGALTVGVAVIVFVAILGAGLRATIDSGVRQQIRADYVISAANNALLSPQVGTILRGAGVAETAVREGVAHTYGHNVTVTGAEPCTIVRFYHFTWASGSSSSAIATLDRGGAIVSREFASDHHLGLGSRFVVLTNSGVRLHLTVHGIQNLPVAVNLAGTITIGAPLFDRSFSQPQDAGVLVDAHGVTAAHRRSLQRLLRGFPDVRIQTVAEFIRTQQTSITMLLNLFDVLLVLSIVVSLFGIVNTLVLSIVERTREIGMLRAIGMTRRQVRRMIRIEGQITALIGSVIGIVVGVALAGLATVALSSWSLSFSVPPTTLVLVLALGFLAGGGASRWPARRAVRLDPLRALQYE